MPTPQPGVLSAGGAHAYFLTFTVADGAERTAPNKAIGDNLSSARALAKKAKTARLQCTLGIGSELWGQLSPASPPPDSGRSAPSRPMGESHRRREGICFCRLPLVVMT